MTTPAPTATRVDYNEVIGRMADRMAAQTAELVMTQVALDAERTAHAATRAELEAAQGADGAAVDEAIKPPTVRARKARGGASGGTTPGAAGGDAPGEG